MRPRPPHGPNLPGQIAAWVVIVIALWGGFWAFEVWDPFSRLAGLGP
jgi:hypothetical protein